MDLGSPGLQEVVLSAFDIGRVARAMIEVGGYTMRTLPDAAPGQWAAWDLARHGARGVNARIEQALLLPPGSRASSVGSGAPIARGCLRVVRFHDAGMQRVMRSSQRSWDTGGIFDVDVFARDVDAVYRGLQRHGWTAFGEPVEYREAEFHVRQVVAIGPDGFVLAVIQRFHPSVAELDDPSTPLTPIFNSTQMVRNFARSSAFLEQLLGWRKTHDFVVDAQVEPGADVLGLPMPHAQTALRRIGIFALPDAQSGTIELIENTSMRGVEFADRCVAPNVGLLALRFCVADAAAYAREIVARGGALYCEPRTFEIAPYGHIDIFSIRMPEGSILEFLSRAH